MNISKKQAAEILSITEDELMFEHQQGRLVASVNEDTMNWEFDITKVLQFKEEREKADAEE